MQHPQEGSYELIEEFLSHSVKFVTKTRVALPVNIVKVQERCPTLYSDIVSYRLKRYPTDYNIATVDSDIKHARKQDMTATDYAQELATKNLGCRSVYLEKMLKASSSAVSRSICAEQPANDVWKINRYHGRHDSEDKFVYRPTRM